MAEVTDVDITAGVPDGGTGTVPTLSKTNTLLGAVTETAPATDTASSGLNGRLQRIAQRLTSLIAATLNVAVTSIIPGTGATNQGKAVDAVAGATDTGVAILAIRDDALTTLTPIDGDYTNLRVNSTGALHVTGSTAGTEYTEDVAAAADPIGQVLLGVRRDTLTVSEVSADGDNIALKASSKGQLHVVNLEPLVAGSNNIGDVDVLSIIPGTGATNQGKAADSAAGATDTGVAILGIRDDALTTLTPVDGDYVPFRLNSTGALHVGDGAALTAISAVEAAVALVEAAIDASAVDSGPQTSALSLSVVEPTDAHVALTFRLLSAAASTNATNVKASAGRLKSIVVRSIAAGERYLKFYNKATAPTVGTDTPILTIPIPSGHHTFGENEFGGMGHYCSLGIGFGITTTAADNSTAALTAGDFECLNILYE